MKILTRTSPTAAPAATGWLRSVLGAFGGTSAPESPAEQFASWLPYAAYQPEEQLFANRGGIGFLLEVAPQTGADESMVEVLKSMYTNCPPGTGLQFHLFASPHLRETLRRYANLRAEDPDQLAKSQPWGRAARNENIPRILARRRFEFLTRGAQCSLTRGFNYLLRDYRLMHSVSVPGDPSSARDRERALALRDSLSATLNAAKLWNRVCNADDLINWASLFVNPDRLTAAHAQRLHYDNGRELRDQIVDRDTIQDARTNSLMFWKESGDGNGPRMEAQFFSIKSFPQNHGLWQMGSLIGDLMQPALQYPAPFLITMGVHVLDRTDVKAAVLGNHLRATQKQGTDLARISPDVRKKLDDWSMAANIVDEGGSLLSIYHQVAVFSAPEKSAECAETAKAIWRNRGFELNADTYMGRQALLASLPMTLDKAMHGDLERMRRTSRKFTANGVHLAPVLAEWSGTGTPTMLFGGRRGQLMPVCLYDSVNNYCGNIVGEPGAGKSVLLNEMACAYSGAGAKVWMQDLGRSFQKLCKRMGGSHIEFSQRSRINANPFARVTDERIGDDGKTEGGINEDLPMLKVVLAKMCSHQRGLDEFQTKALGVVVKKLYQEYGREMTVTAVREAVRGGSIPELDVHGDQRIKDLYVLLSPFAVDGEYGRFFHEGTPLDLSNDFVVIEAEELKRKPELLAVINTVLFQAITGEMYLTRSRRKFWAIDELKQQLGEHGDDPVMAAAIDEASRRARKYGGALVTATQQGNDYFSSTQMQTAFECAANTFLLAMKPETIELLARSGRISMDEAKKRLLQSLRKEDGVYSEMYIHTPLGEGVARLMLDPYSALMYSNTQKDNVPMDALLAQAYTLDDAITAVLRQRGQL